MHEVLNSEVLFERIVNTIQPTLPYAGEIQRCFSQRFRWHRTGVNTRSANLRCSFYNCNTFTKIGGLRSTFFACGPDPITMRSKCSIRYFKPAL